MPREEGRVPKNELKPTPRAERELRVPNCTGSGPVRALYSVTIDRRLRQSNMLVGNEPTIWFFANAKCVRLDNRPNPEGIVP